MSCEIHAPDAEGNLGFGVFDLLQLVLGLLFVVDVEFHEALARGGEGVKAGWEVDAGELALEVGGVAVAVLGVMEDGVGSVEDVPLGDGAVGIVGAKFCECLVGGILPTLTLFIPNVECECLRGLYEEIDIRNRITAKRFKAASSIC